MPRRSLILATGNLHKVEEFKQLLANCSFNVVSAEIYGGMPKVDETGATFTENAFLKAKELHKRAPVDAWVLADDSGLEVDALEGKPGVYSARYAGTDASDTDNIAKLLHALEGVPLEARTARFKCALCVIDHRALATDYEGSCEGHISTHVSGSRGFGYDPVFIPDGYRKSFAELGSVVKGKLSHRARAVQAFSVAHRDGS